MAHRDFDSEPDSARAGWADSAGYAFVTGATTHVGCVRKENEDSLLLMPAKGIWAVADGMGGHVAGKLASSTVVDVLGTIGHSVSASDLLARFEDRFRKANQRLRDLGEEHGLGTFGTTLVAMLSDSHFCAYAWCGDSRVYLVRDGRIMQLSHDHTEVQELLDQGRLTPEEARNWRGRNVVTRALGVFDEIDYDLGRHAIEDGDTLVLCSDGLTAHVRDEEIAASAATADMQAMTDALVNLTLARGAVDNVTVIAVRFRKLPPRSGTTVTAIPGLR